MNKENEQMDLLSELGDFDLIRHLLADMHDDLDGKVTRFRQLVDTSRPITQSSLMFYGGETPAEAWREARWSFIHGNFIATVMLCQGLLEHLLAAFLHASLIAENISPRVSFSETLKLCRDRNVISEKDVTDLRSLMNLRNPLSHFRHVTDPTNLSGRVLGSQISANEHLASDALFAVALTVRILALEPFSG